MKDFVQNINHQFMDYVKKYDLTNDNIIRKVYHTMTVADTCFLIACNLGFDEHDRNLAYLTGILHDIGRFEQWKLYQTYNDHNSVDHGDLSYEKMNEFDLSMLSTEDIETVGLAVKYHTKKYTGDNEKVKLFNKIVMGADSYANVINTANGAQRMTVTESGVTKEILNDFVNMERLWVYSPKTKVDRALMLTANVYYVRFDFLKEQILKNNMIDVIAFEFLKYFDEEDKKIYLDAIELLKSRYLDEKYKNKID